jgi:hypothetical protein
MRFIGARLHGYLDIVFIALFLLGPLVFGLGGTPLVISILLAAVFLLLTLVTGYPMGTTKRITLVAHGLVELAVAVFVALLPKLDGYSPGSPARRFYWAMAVGLAIVWLLTDDRGKDHAHVREAVRPAKVA